MDFLRDIQHWNCVEVIQWLKGIKCPEAIPDFTLHDIDGLKLVNLTEVDLFQMTRIPVSKRKILSKEIKILMEEGMPSTMESPPSTYMCASSTITEGLKSWVKSRESPPPEDDMFARNPQINRLVNQPNYDSDEDGGWGSDFEYDHDNDDYVPPEAYEQPMSNVKSPMMSQGRNTRGPLPPTPSDSPGVIASPPGPGLPSRNNRLQPPGGPGKRPPPPPESHSHSPIDIPPPVPNGPRPNRQKAKTSIPETKAPLPPPQETPPPLPPGRGGRFPRPTPEGARLAVPSPPSTRLAVPSPPSTRLAVPSPPSRLTPRPQPPRPPDEPEVYEIPEDNSETYEELPEDGPIPFPPSSRTAYPPPPLPSGRKSPRPTPPIPMPKSPPPAPPENINQLGSDILNVRLRPTGGPGKKQITNNNNSIDSDKKPGFDTIRANFQERVAINQKRGSLESNQSSEESSGSGEFQGPPSFPSRPAAAKAPSPSNHMTPRRPSLPTPSKSIAPSPPSHSPMQLDGLYSFNWYFGDISRQDADSKVQFTADGTFLVRRSKKGGDTNPYTLVVWCENKVWNVHLRLRHDKTYAVGSARENEQTFTTIPQLVEFHKSNPILLANERGGKRLGQTKLMSSPRK